MIQVPRSRYTLTEGISYDLARSHCAYPYGDWRPSCNWLLRYERTGRKGCDGYSSPDEGYRPEWWTYSEHRQFRDPAVVVGLGVSVERWTDFSVKLEQTLTATYEYRDSANGIAANAPAYQVGVQGFSRSGACPLQTKFAYVIGVETISSDVACPTVGAIGEIERTFTVKAKGTLQGSIAGDAQAACGDPMVSPFPANCYRYNGTTKWTVTWLPASWSFDLSNRDIYINQSSLSTWTTVRFNKFAIGTTVEVGSWRFVLDTGGVISPCGGWGVCYADSLSFIPPSSGTLYADSAFSNGVLDQQSIHVAVNNCPPLGDSLMDNPDFRDSLDFDMTYSNPGGDEDDRHEIPRIGYHNPTTGERRSGPPIYTSDNCQTNSGYNAPAGWTLDWASHTHPNPVGSPMTTCGPTPQRPGREYEHGPSGEDFDFAGGLPVPMCEIHVDKSITCHRGKGSKPNKFVKINGCYVKRP